MKVSKNVCCEIISINTVLNVCIPFSGQFSVCEFLNFGCSFNTCPPSNNSQDGVDADRILRKPKQLHNSLPAASSLDNSCVAARIRPVCKYRKRRLVRVNTVSHLSRKVGVRLQNLCFASAVLVLMLHLHRKHAGSEEY